MTQFARTILNLDGFQGGPGVNVLQWCDIAHVDITDTGVENFHAILGDVFTAAGAGFWADGVTVTINPVVTVHEVDDGTMVGAITDTTGPYTITGSGEGTQSRAVQAGVQLHTGDIRNGRRVQGRSFMGPVAADQLDDNGQILDAVRTGLAEAWSGAIDALGPRLIVWSRPTPTHPVGAYADVTTVSIAQRPFILRGRSL